MSLSARNLRPSSIQDVGAICSRCLRRQLRLSKPGLRPFSTTRRDLTTVAQPNRTAFNKEYFWANGFLSEVFGHPRRGTSNGLSRLRSGGRREAATVTANGQALPTTAEELPHRRRKRLREEAVEELIADDALKKDESPQTSYPIPLDASSTLSAISSALPQQSLKRLFTTYLSLSKPRLTFLVVLTSTAAYSLYPVPTLLDPSITSAPSLSALTLLFLTTGTTLCSASANAFNMWLEPAHDAKMSRTRNRPLVRGLISSRGALLFAVATGVVGTAALYYGVNPTTSFLGAANIALYAFAYTPLKRLSVTNTWVGAVVGGIPPLMGWTAAAGQCASHGGTWQELLLGPESVGGWLLAGLLFAWQFPHFNALSWAVREEYKNAGYRMLCWVNPARNGRVALRYSILMFPLCWGLSASGVTDWGFAITSSAVNAWMALAGYKFWKFEGAKGTARSLFWASVWHLPIVMVLAMVHKKGLWERVWQMLTGQSAATEDEEDDEEEEEEEGEPDAIVRR